MPRIRVGDQAILNMWLHDEATNKYVRAHCRNAAGTVLSGSPFTLSHIARGHYQAKPFTMPLSQEIEVIYEVYNDAGFTTPSPDHLGAFELIELDQSASGSGSTQVIEVEATIDANEVDLEAEVQPDVE